MLPTIFRKAALQKQTGALARARERFRDVKQERARPAQIAFVIDATASRQQTWELAQVTQARMFRAVRTIGPLALRLIHFGGFGVHDRGTYRDAARLQADMASVRCVMGSTQILPSLRLLLGDEPPKAVILIGDCFEEDHDEARRVARDLSLAEVKVFSFHEGDDDTAADIFAMLARETGGKFARFGAELPLADLCEGVAVLAIGGEKAAKQRIANRKVAELLLPPPGKR